MGEISEMIQEGILCSECGGYVDDMAVSHSTVFHGDCLEIMKNISDGSIDMILCDLPYGTTACKWDVVIPFDKLWEQYNRIVKPNSCIALFGNEPFSSALRMSNIKQYKYDWVWDKVSGGNPFNNKVMPMKTTENIIVFSGGSKINYYPLMEKANPKNIRPDSSAPQKTQLLNKFKNGFYRKTDANLRFPKNLIKFNIREKECNSLNRVHPTQKPVALLEYLIKTYTNEGDIVLDNCAGSGTTGIACMNTNRNYILIEKEKKYFDIINERIAKHTQQRAGEW